jgi:hypothetical protein
MIIVWSFPLNLGVLYKNTHGLTVTEDLFFDQYCPSLPFFPPCDGDP